MSGAFIYPPPFGDVGNYSDMVNIYIGKPVTVTWTSSPLDSIIWLLKDGDQNYCQIPGPSGPAYAKLSCELLLGGNRGLSWIWNVQMPQNYSRSAPIYYINMRASNGTGLFASHYLNILPGSEAGTSSSLSASSSSIVTPGSSSTSTIASSSSSSSPNSAAAPSSAASSDTGLSSGTKVAVGTAVGIGIPLILLLAFIAFLLHKNAKKKRNARNPASLHQQSTSQPPNYRNNLNQSSFNKDNSYADHQRFGLPQELAVNGYHRPPAEMGSFR